MGRSDKRTLTQIIRVPSTVGIRQLARRMTGLLRATLLPSTNSRRVVIRCAFFYIDVAYFNIYVFVRLGII